MTLRDELAADRPDRRRKCVVCAWLDSMPAADREEWDSVMEDPTFTHSQVMRAIRRRHDGISYSSVTRHRVGHVR